MSHGTTGFSYPAGKSAGRERPFPPEPWEQGRSPQNNTRIAPFLRWIYKKGTVSWFYPVRPAELPGLPYRTAHMQTETLLDPGWLWLEEKFWRRYPACSTASSVCLLYTSRCV